MNNIIISCFCYLEQWESGNLKTDRNYEIYLKNSFVCLKSAKINNPSRKCILCLNKMPPSNYLKLFEQNLIEIRIIPFSNYVFDKNYKWALAYYKLNVLKHISNGEICFDNLILLDNDVYVKESLDNVFFDIKKYILVYDLCRRLNSPEYNVYYDDLKMVFGKDVFPSILYGGEFIGINQTMLKSMINEFDALYNEIVKSRICLKSGDEFFLSVFAHNHKNQILNAGNYIGRYWTGMFRIHSENSGYNYVKILHCPSEKQFGFIRLFKYLKKDVRLTDKKVYKTLHLYHGHFHLPTIIWYLRTHKKNK